MNAYHTTKTTCVSEFHSASGRRSESKRPDVGRPTLVGTAGFLRYEVPRRIINVCYCL